MPLSTERLPFRGGGPLTPERRLRGSIGPLRGPDFTREDLATAGVYRRLVSDFAC